MCGGANTIPFSDMSAASSMTLAACSRALDGMQPSFKQTPPSTGQRSIKVTLSPRSAARKAAVYPPTPAPRTTKSTAPSGAVEVGMLGLADGADAVDEVSAVAGAGAGAGAAAFAGTGAEVGAGTAAGACADSAFAVG